MGLGLCDLVDEGGEWSSSKGAFLNKEEGWQISWHGRDWTSLRVFSEVVKLCHSYFYVFLFLGLNSSKQPSNQCGMWKQLRGLNA